MNILNSYLIFDMGNSFGRNKKSKVHNSVRYDSIATDPPSPRPVRRNESSTLRNRKGKRKRKKPALDPIDPPNASTSTTASSGLVKPTIDVQRPKKKLKKPKVPDRKGKRPETNADKINYCKNKCTVDFTRVSCVWAYQANNRKGWWFMDTDTSAQVDNLYHRWRKGKNVSGTTISNRYGKFRYDFDRNIQRGVSTGNSRAICRLTKNDIEEIKNRYQDLPKYSWFFMVNRKWVAFPPEAHGQIESLYQEQDGKGRVSYKCPNGCTYELNFDDMSQYNTKSRKKREIIRRKMVATPKESSSSSSYSYSSDSGEEKDGSNLSSISFSSSDLSGDEGNNNTINVNYL
jgi:hypothetical protein